jgi:hypothetical protein
MNAAVTDNDATTTATVNAPATAAQDLGAKAMLRLWSILTTNPRLLQLLLNTPVDPPTTPFYPLAADPTKPDTTKPNPANPETVLNWSQLSAALTAGCSGPSNMFQPAALQGYLIDHFKKAAADVDGKPTLDVKGKALMNSDGQALTYGDVYSAACQAFDGFWAPILKWGHPSPETFGEITS